MQECHRLHRTENSGKAEKKRGEKNDLLGGQFRIPGRLRRLRSNTTRRETLRVEIRISKILTIFLRVGAILAEPCVFPMFTAPPEEHGYTDVGLQTYVAAFVGFSHPPFKYQSIPLLCPPYVTTEKNIGEIICAEIGSNLFSNQEFQKPLQEANFSPFSSSLGGLLSNLRLFPILHI